MNAIDLLEEQHRQVDELLERLTGDSSPSGKRKRETFGRVADQLAIHATLEEMHFYPSVKAASTEDILRESLEEHLAVKRLLADLMMLAPEDKKFDAKLAVLKEQVQHHVEEERNELFPKVRQLLDADQLEAIGQLMTGTMVELEKGPPARLDVPAQTTTTPPLSGYTGDRGGHIASRLFPRVARLLAVPMQIVSAAKSAVLFARSVSRRRREA